MKGSNQTQSAIAAGYSEKTAKIKGSQLAKDKDVRAYMERVTSISEPAPVEERAQEKREVEPQLEKPVRYEDPIEVMKKIMNDNILLDPKLSLEAAAKLAPTSARKLQSPARRQQKMKQRKEPWVSLAQWRRLNLS